MCKEFFEGSLKKGEDNFCMCDSVGSNAFELNYEKSISFWKASLKLNEQMPYATEDKTSSIVGLLARLAMTIKMRMNSNFTAFIVTPQTGAQIINPVKMSHKNCSGVV